METKKERLVRASRYLRCLRQQTEGRVVGQHSQAKVLLFLLPCNGLLDLRSHGNGGLSRVANDCSTRDRMTLDGTAMLPRVQWRLLLSKVDTVPDHALLSFPQLNVSIQNMKN